MMAMRACQMCEAKTGNHPPGSVARRERCGCDVAGIGLLPNPWHIHPCALHAAAPEMLALLTHVPHAQTLHMDGQPHVGGCPGCTARALRARIEGKVWP